MADDKSSTVASPVKVAEEKEVVDGVEVGTTTPAKSPVKAKDTTESTETSEAPTNGSPEKRDVAKEDTASETPNGDSTVVASEPVCPVKRKSGVTKEGDKEDDVPTPEKKAKKDDDSEVADKETASA